MGRKSSSKRKPGKDRAENLIRFGHRRVDLVRFAYDVIVHSAVKFGVPKGCIEKWPGSENDYEDEKFVEVLSLCIFKYQILRRYVWHKEFNLRYESNGLNSLTDVSDLLKDVISNSVGSEGNSILDDVEISLSVACELVIFLYSKNLELYVMKLAKHWLDCYLLSGRGYRAKNRFENEGGLYRLYEKSKGKYYDNMHGFYDIFIKVHCNNYETSSKVDLREQFLMSFAPFAGKVSDIYLMAEYRKYLSKGTEHSVEVSIPPTSKGDEASGIDLPENPGLGIPPHEEMLRDVLASSAGTTPSQNLPGASSLETAKRRRTPSDPQKRQKSRYSLRSRVEHGLGQVSSHSSGTKQSSEKKSVSVVNDPTPAQKPSGISPQELAMQLKRRSGDQEIKSSLFSSVEKSLGQLSLESLAIEQSSEKKHSVMVASDPTPPQPLLGASCQESAKTQRGSSSQKERTSKSNSCSSDEEDEQLN